MVVKKVNRSVCVGRWVGVGVCRWIGRRECGCGWVCRCGCV